MYHIRNSFFNKKNAKHNIGNKTIQLTSKQEPTDTREQTTRRSGKMSVKGKHAAAAALLLCLADSSSDEDVDKEDTKKCWQATWLKRRKALGFYDNLVRELAMEDSDAYRRLLRMDMDSFNILLELVRPRIKKEDTNFREAISAGNRLTITLRYLATGKCSSCLDSSSL